MSLNTTFKSGPFSSPDPMANNQPTTGYGGDLDKPNQNSVVGQTQFAAPGSTPATLETTMEAMSRSISPVNFGKNQ